MSEIEDLKQRLDRELADVKRLQERQAEHDRLLNDADKRLRDAEIVTRDFNELKRRFEEKHEEQTRKLTETEKRQDDHDRVLHDADKRLRDTENVTRDFNESKRRFEEKQNEQTRKLTETEMRLQGAELTRKHFEDGHAARLADAEAKLGRAQSKLQFYEKAFWVVGAVAAILGITIGSQISSAKSEIEDLTTKSTTLTTKNETLTTQATTLTGQVTDLEQKMKSWDDLVKTSITKITDQETTSRDALLKEQERLSGELKKETTEAKKVLGDELTAQVKKLGEQTTKEVAKINASGAAMFEPKGTTAALAEKLADGSLSLKCRRLDVVDGDGNSRVELSVHAHGGQALIRNARNQSAINHSATEFGAYTLMADRNGRDLVVFGFWKGTDEPFLALRNPDKSERPKEIVDAVLLTADGVGGQVRIFNAAAQRVELRATSDGAAVGVKNAEGRNYVLQPLR